MKPPIELSIERERGWTRIAVAGEIDLATAESFRSALRAELESGGLVLVDLAACTFIDSVGLSVLVEAAPTEASGGKPAIGIVAPSAEVRRLIELTQLHSLIPVYGSAAEAAGQPRPGKAPAS